MRVSEIPVVFECEGDELLGMVHAPEQASPRGVLLILAGASQYRGGMCRGQVKMAREWAAQGIPVMRFDHRGLGDSEGPFVGFKDLEADLAAALRTFHATVPEMREVAVFGGCDAASGAMINAWKFPNVSGMILINPWVHNEVTGDKVAVAHFGQRLKDWDFWLKVLRGGYNPLPALGTLARVLWGRLTGPFRRHGSQGESSDYRDSPNLPHLQRMRQGLQNFKGEVLLLMSGRSLVSREFDLVVQDDPAWQKAMGSPRRWARHDMPDADQALSTIADRDEASRAVLSWMLNPTAAIPPASQPRARPTSS